MFSQRSPYTFVQRTYPPMIGCLSSPTVEQICQKNNLSFVEMLRPFCTVNVEHQLRDPTGNDHMIKNLQICIQDVNDKPLEPTRSKKLLNEIVNNSQSEGSKAIMINNLSLDIPMDCKWFHSWSRTFLLVQYPSDHEFTKHLLGCLLVTSTADPPETLQSLLQSLQQLRSSKLPKWFSPNIFKYYVLVHDVKDGDKEKALSFFNSLKSAYGPEHCFFLEINSQQNQDPSTVIQDYWVHYLLHKTSDSDGSGHGSSPRTPVELNNLTGMPNTLVQDLNTARRTGDSPEVAQEAGETHQPVVLHPLSPDLEDRPNNFIDSSQTQSDEVHKVVNLNVWSGLQGLYQHGNYLTPHDIGNIKSLIKNLVVHVLLPHVEKQIFQLHDLASNKKGVSRSLLSATKRLFGTSKPGSPGTTSVNSVIYTYDAPELQLRRLGDLYFMFTHYSLAFQAYHSAKRDFASDQAYVYLAGALEMAALSAFMQGDMSKKALDYMEEAILIYLNSCKLPQFATRATLLSTHFLKDRQMFGEAGKQLIRMTSEDSDLCSALLLEQASYCFLYSSRPNMFRKYAFHMVLAGRRYSKAGQRKHALRCYKQAFQVYMNKNWTLAEDHIHFTIGRLAGQLKLLDEGTVSLSSLLSSESKQTPGQQVTYLREYLQILQQVYTEESLKELSTLPLPKIEDNSARVLVSVSPKINLVQAFEPDSPADSIRWARMEEVALTESQGPQMIFRPTIYLFSKNTNNASHPIAVVNETIYVQVCLKNPLQIPLPLLRVRLLWNFEKLDGETISSQELIETDGNFNSYIKTSELDSISIDRNSSQEVTLTLMPLIPGQVEVLGIFYMLACPGGEIIQPTDFPAVPGKQLFVVRGPKMKVKKEKSDSIYEVDNRLKIKVLEALPLLQVEVQKFRGDMLCGEMERIEIRMKNEGNAPLKNLYLVTSSPQLFSVSRNDIISEKIVNDSTSGYGSDQDDLNRGKNSTYKIIKISLPDDGVLKASEEIVLPLWIRAPDTKGSTRINMLFYYENTLAESNPQRYRITRFSQDIIVHDSLQLSAVVARSNLCEDKDTMTIVLNVKNLNQSGDLLGNVKVYLLQISLATSKWQLHPKAIYTKDLKLFSQESYSFVVRAFRRSNEDGEISDICLQDDKMDPGGIQPYYDFYKWHMYDGKDNNALGNLYKMVLCLRWKGDVICPDQSLKHVNGLSHVTVTDLAVLSVWPVEPKYPLQHDQVETLKIFGLERRSHLDKKQMKKVKLENALSYNLLHDYNIEHSFKEKRICRAEMKLVLRNCIDLPLRVLINAPGMRHLRPTGTRMQLYTPHSSSTFNWTSRSNALVHLAGNERRTVMLAAAFSAPGTYDLGSRLIVEAAMEDESEYTRQLCSIESSIIISERDSEMN